MYVHNWYPFAKFLFVEQMASENLNVPLDEEDIDELKRLINDLGQCNNMDVNYL